MKWEVERKRKKVKGEEKDDNRSKNCEATIRDSILELRDRVDPEKVEALNEKYLKDLEDEESSNLREKEGHFHLFEPKEAKDDQIENKEHQNDNDQFVWLIVLENDISLLWS